MLYTGYTHVLRKYNRTVQQSRPRKRQRPAYRKPMRKKYFDQNELAKAYCKIIRLIAREEVKCS